MVRWMNEWMDGRIDGWMDGWMDCWTQIDTFPFILFLSAFQRHPFVHYSKLFEMREVDWASRWESMEKPKNDGKPSRVSLQHVSFCLRVKFPTFFVYFHFTNRIAKVTANHFLHESYMFESLFAIRGSELAFPLRTESKTKK